MLAARGVCVCVCAIVCREQQSVHSSTVASSEFTKMAANHLAVAACLLLTLANIPTQATSSRFSTTPLSVISKAMLGVDPVLSNPLGKRDPGLKNQIFVPAKSIGAHRETIELNNFIGKAVQDVRCDRVSSSSMTTVSNFNTYRTMMTDSVSFKRGGGISAQYNGFGGGVHVGYGSGSNTSNEKYKEFFRQTEGEIVLGGAECQTHVVTVSLNTKPVFTENFIVGLRKLNLASQNPQSENSVHAFQDFVENFGTHFQDTTVLGSKLTIEKLFSRKAANTTESTDRKDCVSSSFSKSVQLNAVFAKAESQFRRDAKNCSGSHSSSNAFNSLGLSSERIITVGTPPYSDPDEWAVHALQTPVPIHYTLEKISRMFTQDWFDDIAPDEKLNGTAMRDFFESLSRQYCKIMLQRPCTATWAGCGYNSNCRLREMCVDDDTAAGGFSCKRKRCGLNSNCSFWEMCVDDDTAADGFTCRKGCGITGDCPSNKICVNVNSAKGFRCEALCSSSHLACSPGESCHAEPHSARGFICVPTKPGTAVLAGGYDGSSTYLKEVESLNYAAFPDLPQPVRFNAMARAGDHLYSCGGLRRDSPGYYTTADCHRINAHTPGSEWQYVQSLPIELRGSAVSVGDTLIWFFERSTLVKLDADRQLYTTVALPFYSNTYHCSVSNGTHAYVIGAGIAYNEIWTNKNPMDETEWELAGHLMETRHGHGCLWYDSNIMITGGYFRRSDVELFNTETREVWAGKEMPKGLDDHKMMLHNGMPSVVGGDDGSYTSRITSFSIRENRWIESSMKLKTAKDDFALVEV